MSSTVLTELQSNICWRFYSSYLPKTCCPRNTLFKELEKGTKSFLPLYLGNSYDCTCFGSDSSPELDESFLTMLVYWLQLFNRHLTWCHQCLIRQASSIMLLLWWYNVLASQQKWPSYWEKTCRILFQKTKSLITWTFLLSKNSFIPWTPTLRYLLSGRRRTHNGSWIVIARYAGSSVIIKITQPMDSGDHRNDSLQLAWSSNDG